MEFETHDKWFKAILDIKATHEGDLLHDTKRFGSFFWFEKMLEKCQVNCCPVFTPSVLYALSDISMEGYINERISLKDDRFSGPDKKRRLALERIKRVLACTKKPNFNKDLFAIDSNELLQLKGNEVTYYGARKRKAYWAYMKLRPHNQSHRDFCNACEFIETIHGISNAHHCTQADVETVRRVLEENFHIANPVDLYRVCLVREKLE